MNDINEAKMVTRQPGTGETKKRLREVKFVSGSFNIKSYLVMTLSTVRQVQRETLLSMLDIIVRSS